MRRPYPTDLSDAEWLCIQPYLPTPKAPGRPRVHSLREILNAIYYIVRSGCAWRLLPHEFPPWKTIHHYFRTWRIDGTWERLHAGRSQSTAAASRGLDLHLQDPGCHRPNRGDRPIPGLPAGAASPDAAQLSDAGRRDEEDRG